MSAYTKPTYHLQGLEGVLWPWTVIYWWCHLASNVHTERRTMVTILELYSGIIIELSSMAMTMMMMMIFITVIVLFVLRKQKRWDAVLFTIWPHFFFPVSAFLPKCSQYSEVCAVILHKLWFNNVTASPRYSIWLSFSYRWSQLPLVPVTGGSQSPVVPSWENHADHSWKTA